VPKYSFSIDYTAPLPNALDSPAGGWGRGLQNLAILLGEAGHKVDFYTPNPQKVQKTYSGVSFIDIDHDQKQTYDIVFWNGWSDNTPTRIGRAYVYLEFFRNWEGARPQQKQFLSKDNVYIGYPFETEAELFKDPSSEFRDKSVLFPFPILQEFSTTYGFDRNSWCFSLKPYQFPDLFAENYTAAKQFVVDRAQKEGKHIGNFPKGKQPLSAVLSALDTTQLLFPFSPSGSTLEAVVNGVMALPVFKGAEHVQKYLPFGYATERAGTYLEYPLDLNKLDQILTQLLTEEEYYIQSVNILREELESNQKTKALGIIEQLATQFI
jgi:hypothetical protein